MDESSPLLSDTDSTFHRKLVVALGNTLRQTMLPSLGKTHLKYCLMETFQLRKYLAEILLQMFTLN